MAGHSKWANIKHKKAAQDASTATVTGTPKAVASETSSTASTKPKQGSKDGK